MPFIQVQKALGEIEEEGWALTQARPIVFQHVVVPEDYLPVGLVLVCDQNLGLASGPGRQKGIFTFVWRGSSKEIETLCC